MTQIMIDEDELTTYVDVLNRVIDGEDVTNDSSDLAFALENLRDLLESQTPDVVDDTPTEYKYGWTPEKVVDSWLLRKRKIDKRQMFDSVMASYREIGEPFCMKVTELFMDKHPEQFVETSGGNVGDNI